MVNVIIPHYNNYEGLRDLLTSLTLQSKKTFVTTIVDDCSDNIEEVKKVVNDFKGKIKLELLQTSHNQGPGAARNVGLFGIDERFFDYVMFVDSDDFLLPRAIELLYKSAKQSNADIVSGPIIRETYLSNDKIPKENNTWCHNKLYKVSFLRTHNIYFPFIRANEDSSFNMMANELMEKRVYIDDELYLWRNNKKSITRKDNFYEKYAYLYIDAFVYAYENVLGYKPLEKTVLSINVPNLYFYYQISKIMDTTGTQVSHMDKCLTQFFQDYEIIPYIKDKIEEIAKNIQCNFIYNHQVYWFKENFEDWLTRLGE